MMGNIYRRNIDTFVISGKTNNRVFKLKSNKHKHVQRHEENIAFVNGLK